jgi:hypothetical protein
MCFCWLSLQRPWGGDGSAYKTLAAVMAELGHAFVDVLKVDIEGGEWHVFNDDVLCAEGRTAAGGLPFGQVRPHPQTGLKRRKAGTFPSRQHIIRDTFCNGGEG